MFPSSCELFTVFGCVVCASVNSISIGNPYSCTIAGGRILLLQICTNQQIHLASRQRWSGSTKLDHFITSPNFTGNSVRIQFTVNNDNHSPNSPTVQYFTFSTGKIRSTASGYFLLFYFPASGTNFAEIDPVASEKASEKRGLSNTFTTANN